MLLVGCWTVDPAGNGKLEAGAYVDVGPGVGAPASPPCDVEGGVVEVRLPMLEKE